ncbi:MAG: hypothetical protein OXN27_18640 [Candidatus Poribacteria bacterium]|nr:hypothetical protein [Candidatus Poribacteria bacterium]
MYVRTEDDQHLEIHEEEDDLPYVTPVSAKEWGLVIDNVEFEDDEDDEEMVTIATFETVADANSALKSLRTAIELDQGWDAIEFKKSLESGANV